jgi:voltage-dependent potassium channel beta subunit
MAFAYDNGVNFFDNAQAYAGGMAETIMGKALKELSWARESYLISSKYYFGIQEGENTKFTLNRKFLLEAVPRSLERLQLDCLDIAYCHRYDPETEIEEIVTAMSDIVDRGWAHYWGTSQWPADKIIEAYEFAQENNLRAPVVEQTQYNLLHREKMEKEYLPIFDKYKMGTTIWSPLQSGLLTGKYFDASYNKGRLNKPEYEWLGSQLLTEEKLNLAKRIGEVASELDVPMAQLAIAWCLKNPNVSTVILGGTSMKQWKQNLEASSVVELLDENVMQRLAEIIKDYWGEEIVG